MIVESVNTGAVRKIEWEGKAYRTGIFKFPVDTPIQLGKRDVVGDQVIDRRYHGGIDKACYSFSSEEYEFWKPLYPEHDFQFGMFGENLTIKGLDETTLSIGDTFQVGTAIIQVSEPRQPCVKLNIRFNSKTAMKTFISRERCGAYFRVLEEGFVKKGDPILLQREATERMSLQEVFQLLYGKGKIERVHCAIHIPELGISVKEDLRRIWKIRS